MGREREPRRNTLFCTRFRYESPLQFGLHRGSQPELPLR
jgi:hypothetical protein